MTRSMSKLGFAALVLAAILGLTFANGCGGGTTLPALKASYGPVSGEKAFEHVKAMCAFGPRPAGSAALKQNADYIRDELKKLGIEAKYQEFTKDNAPGITFRNVWCEIPGEDPEGGPIVIVCAHYDTKKTAGHADPAQNFEFLGAIDGAGGSSILLEHARVFSQEKQKCNIWLVWFDGEESIPYDWDDNLSLIGSTHFAEYLSTSKILPRVRALVLMDLIGSKNLKIDRDAMSKKSLNELFLETATEMGEADRMFRFVQRDLKDDHIPFQKKGVATIDLIDFRYRHSRDRRQHGDRDAALEGEFEQWWHTPKDRPEAMDPRALDFVGNLVHRAIPKICK